MKNLLLLHGAIGSESQFDSIKVELANDFNAFTLNFPGHGGEVIPDGGFSIEMFADAVVDFLDSNSLDKVSIFGYSMGGGRGSVGAGCASRLPARSDAVVHRPLPGADGAAPSNRSEPWLPLLHGMRQEPMGRGPRLRRGGVSRSRP